MKITEQNLIRDFLEISYRQFLKIPIRPTGFHPFGFPSRETLPPRTLRSGLCPENPPRAARPMEPRQGVTLPLDPPLRGFNL